MSLSKTPDLTFRPSTSTDKRKYFRLVDKGGLTGVFLVLLTHNNSAPTVLLMQLANIQAIVKKVKCTKAIEERLINSKIAHAIPKNIRQANAMFPFFSFGSL